MDGLVIGLDLSNEYTQISCVEEDKTWTIPTVICKEKSGSLWHIGEDAYAYTLVGDGVIVDQLVKLAAKKGTATILGTKYEARELIAQFLKRVVEIPQKELGREKIGQLVIAVPDMDSELMNALIDCADTIGLEKDQIHVLSHTESFVYYVLSQKKEIWNNEVGMFDLSEKRLRYYELKVQRGMKKTTVKAEYEKLEEGFSLDILSSSSGGHLADKILCSCGERLMQNKLFSAVFLTGKGFETQDWAVEFMKLVCSKRRVYMETAVFARGACYRAADYMREKTVYPVACICEGRLDSTIMLNVLVKGQEMPFVVAEAGDSWYEAQNSVDVITDRQDYMEFVAAPVGAKKSKLIKIPLEGFPARPDRTTRVGIGVSFLDEKTMLVELEDKGFGELFPASGTKIRQEVMI